MERNQLLRQMNSMRQSFFDQFLQGFLDEQFVQLEELQDEANPNFVEEVVTLCYRDSYRLILNLEQALQKSPLDFNQLDSYIQQFKGSSSRCFRTFHQLKKEHTTLKRKFEAYFQIKRQAGPSQIASRPK
ncbi:pseudo histidine-containing phosphotransfer protein 5 isoform X3 [Cucumis sativus]|uniref:pseudo histidine-containing phosphotransfer protein 5 isoform X3 n=1 Tax=Cucumis sativus TaxID=3659 RepID=UPI0005EC4129|nr:pseudo histidine-containing phosphotransfer protein 5 isoform X3 [Cucumis sativus]